LNEESNQWYIFNNLSQARAFAKGLSQPCAIAWRGYNKALDSRIMKVLVVGVWTYVTCILPALLGKPIYPLETYTLPSLFILAISLLFDLRDREIDNASRKTIPQLIGERATKIVVVILLVSYLILNQLFNIVISLDWVFAAVLLLLTLMFAFKDTKSTYYGTLLELTLVVLGVGYW
jgi:4-hydroxybenzoate polyprenyltransferase